MVLGPTLDGCQKEPTKPVVHDHTEVRVREHAVYADIILKDADGRFWKFSGASFYFDLEPVEPPK